MEKERWQKGLKVGAMAVTLLLLIGGVFAAGNPAKQHNGKYEPTRNVFKWAEKYYSAPGEHVYEINGTAVNITVDRHGRIADVMIALKDAGGNEIKSSMSIEKTNNTAFKMRSGSESAIVTPETSLIDPSVTFSYSVGDYPGTYAGSSSHGECLFTWRATDTSKLSTSTGNLTYSGPSIGLVKVFGLCVPAIHFDTQSEITDTKGFSLSDGGNPATNTVFYPYSNTNTWKSVKVNWIYAVF